jgi:probable H4MPT-linked C1 transfer pathway protein
MPSTILGLDIGGANLKAATPDQRAVSVPFALWKQPDKLPAALAELVGRFSDAEELAVTMTGELCDCYETRREGVNAIIEALEFAAGARRVRVWSTDGVFIAPGEARREYLKVASANWHALATFAGRYSPDAGGLLIDIGSTTTDIIPLHYGVPRTSARTDQARLQAREMIYVGVRRTPVCAVWRAQTCAELFATTQDVYVALGQIAEEPDNLDTADGRPLTRVHSLARLARIIGTDRELESDEYIVKFARRVSRLIEADIAEAVRLAYFDFWKDAPPLETLIVSGAGEFVAKHLPALVPGAESIRRNVSMKEVLGPAVSACAPAYAVAVLAAEQS